MNLSRLLPLLLASGFLFRTSSFAADAPQLIPFQGRLTNQAGTAYDNGQYTLTFNLYDQAVGGATVWTERHEKVGVINGMANVFLGAIQPLTNVPFESTKYLGITVDADANPATADPEMVPRTMVVPAFFAKNSQKLAGFDWSPLMQGAVNNPQTGFLRGDKVQAGSITTMQILDGGITSSDIGNGQVTEQKIAAGAITDTKLGTGAIGTNALLDNDVTSIDIRNGTIQNVDIAAGTIAPDRLLPQFAIFGHRLASNIQSAQNITARTWTKAELNADITTEPSRLADAEFAHPDIELTAGNRIKLKAVGIYYISGRIPVTHAEMYVSRIARISGVNATTALLGTPGLAEMNSISGSNAGDTSSSVVTGYLKVTAPPEEFELQLTTEIASSNAFGIASSNAYPLGQAENNIFSTVQVIKVR